MNEWLHWVDILGVAVFAISGTLMAHKKHMDGFGVVVLASVTAIGGGTTRDLILDVPVFWVQDNSYLYSILIAAFFTIIWVRNNDKFPLRFLLLADAIGLAFFNIMGVQKALSLGVTPLVAVVMGTMTGVFGGLIRDVMCREIPLVLKGELYATTCVVGGSLCCFAWYLGLAAEYCMVIGGITTLTMRIMAMRWHWSLPVFNQPE
ncbi:trimeric intracellular cation channel family protein [Neptunicella sp. SCSIO 80796]|uniref:trimeric intracellular cation channel family protein n=1 Tax=Neptunicella plasticusilytica TaxID=3117012 RepID=UPI003A4D45A5